MANQPKQSPTRLALLGIVMSSGLVLSACRPATPRPEATPTIDPAAVTAAAPAPTGPEATAAPTAEAPTPDAAATTAAGVAAGEAAAVSKSLPGAINIDASGLAEKVAAETRPAVASEPQTPAFAAGLPEHVRIKFADDVLTNEYVDPQQRQVLVIPIAEYLAKFADTPDTQKDIQDQIVTLKTLLRRRSTRVAEPITVMPPFNAAQIFRSRIKHLKFKGGTGVRFVTAYAQDTLPITSADIFYTFQGLTDDGKYYVSAFIPVRTQLLTESRDKVPQKELDDSANRFDSYLRTITRKLEGAKPDAFTPNMNAIDVVMQSIELVAPPVEAAPAEAQTATEATATPAAAATTGDAAAATATPAATTADATAVATAAVATAAAPATTDGDVKTGRTTVTVNLRAQPSTRSRVVVLLRRNASVQVTGRNEASTWLRVTTSGGREGWIFARYVRGVTVSELPVVP